SSITLDAWMGASNEMIPPCSSAVRALRWRFTKFAPSTTTRPVFRYTRITFPTCPLSSPRSTFTVSPVVTCSFTRSEFCACRFWPLFRARSVFLYLRIRILQDLGRERDDLHVLLLAQLAGDRAEDTRRPRLARIIDDHHGVLVEADVAAVLPPRLLHRAHDDRLRDVALLHRPVRERVLHGHDDDVAEAGIAPARSAEDADHERRLGPRVVRDLHHRLLLDHGRPPLPCTLHDLDDTPPLVLRQRTRLHDPHGVADLRRVLLVVGLQALRARHHLAVDGMRHATLDRDHHRLLHLVAHHEAGARLARAAGCGLLLVGHLSHGSFLPRSARALELALAQDGLEPRDVLADPAQPERILEGLGS